MRVVGVVLAAGESRRMGRLKALLPFGAHTVIEHVLQPLLQADIMVSAVSLGGFQLLNLRNRLEMLQ